MLEIRKGKSVRSYENEFFRKVSAELSQLFEQRNWNGILLGMPECITRADLQIDCLLLTENQILIIDFKNYDGKLKLPYEQNFSNGHWILNNRTRVKGGNSSNPFGQLKRQKQKLSDELNIQNYDFNFKSISTIVCFQQKVEIIGSIPGKQQMSFFIVDSTNYLNKIVDILDVVAERRVNHLSDKGRQLFTETLFSADSYQLNVQLEPKVPEVQVEKPLKHDDYLKQIEAFLKSDNRIMTVTGNVRSGKTALIPGIREAAFNSGFNDAPVFAYSNRLRRKMLQSNPELEEVDSLFNSIFDFRGETIDESYKKIIPVRTHDEIYDQENTLYIIDDSHLISNSNFDSDLLQFGSGCLLDDVFDYLGLASHPERKVIFIGDKNKLSYGSNTDNALNPEYLKTLLSAKEVTTEIDTIHLSDNQSESEIIKVCNQISKNIRNDQYNELSLPSGEELTVCGEQEKVPLLKAAYLSPINSKILVYSNKQANLANSWIKKHLVKNGSSLNPKDFVVFNATTQATQSVATENEMSPFDHLNQLSSTELQRVDNGYFGEVLTVDHNHTIEKHLFINDEKVLLRFIPCQIKLQDGSIIETLVFENYLMSDRNELEKNELIAYQTILSSYEKIAFMSEPFESSSEYQEMLRHPEQYAVIKKDGKPLYRSPDDKRKLTLFEKSYRDRVLKKLKVPASEYFKLLNASKVKFGWAMTVNKAMAYSFETVYFNTYQDEHRGRTNKEYFKWMYTGISSGLNNVLLFNWKPISPFLKTEFSGASPVRKENNNTGMFTLSDGEQTSAEQLRNHLEVKLSDVATVTEIASRKNLEMVTLEMNNRHIKLFFDYNGKAEMKIPRLRSGEEEDYVTLLSLLQPTPKDLINEIGVMKPALQELANLLEAFEIHVKVANHREWNVLLNATKQKNTVDIQLWYNGNSMITRFSYVHGSDELYDEIITAIKKLYVLN